jgi:radical SAM protein with 4Fe4S-binding SPASM domain
MKSNIEELPKLVELAGKIGVEEVKVVYLTAFNKEMEKEVLYNEQSLVKKVFKEAEITGDKLGVILKLPHIQGEDVAGKSSHKPCYVAWRDFFVGSDGYVRPCMSTPKKFFEFDKKFKFEGMWNFKEFCDFREEVNDENKMDNACKRCYQSSHCNWNIKETFIQVNETFAPKWED